MAGNVKPFSTGPVTMVKVVQRLDGWMDGWA